jgi:aldehyde:ferredoxin oxidoreductase
VYGWTGKILMVDLTTGTLRSEELNEQFASEYIGQRGLALRYYFEACGCATAPFSAENRVVLMTGPLTGALGIGTGHYAAVAGTPMSGSGFEPTGGGHFGPELKYAGYDGIVICGRAESPVYLEIRDDRAALLPAGDLWGKSAPEAVAILVKRLGPGARACCIGPAGEAGNPLACLVTDGVRTAGTGGVGAVLGYKNLKGIAVRGSGSVKLADPEEYMELIRRCRRDISACAGGFRLGTGAADALRAFGEDTAEILRHKACFSCSVGCRYEFRPAGEPHAGFYECPPPEVTQLLGSACGVTDPAAVLYAYDLCLRYGVDPLSCARTVAAFGGCAGITELVEAVCAGKADVKAQKAAAAAPVRVFADAAGICPLCSGIISAADAAAMFGLATGSKFTAAEAAIAGERILALEEIISGAAPAV